VSTGAKHRGASSGRLTAVQDAPDAAQLLGAIADVLEHKVLPQAGAAAHDVRVAANLCRILEREHRLDGPADARAREALGDLLGDQGTSGQLWRALADRLRADDVDDEFERRSFDVALAVVRDKLAVAKPGYDTETPS
jgi:hypothetical protein